MKINKNYIIIGLIVIATGLLWMNINKKDFTSGKNYKSLVDSLRKHIIIQESLILDMNTKVDSLNQVNTFIDTNIATIAVIEQEVKHHYHETYTYIPYASNFKLDSIVRANWR